jgi:hypothetical protein
MQRKEMLRRRNLSNALALVWFLFVVGGIALGSLVTWVVGIPDDKPRVGAPCGPGHSWTYIQTNVSGPEVSCERD